MLDGRKLGMVSVLGNGHFDSPFEDGTYQLAMCLLLRQLYQAEFDFRVWKSLFTYKLEHVGFNNKVYQMKF